MATLPSIRLLAGACGVSTATVSRALAGNLSVRAATRKRILTEAARHGYQRNLLVGALMTAVRKTRTPRFSGNLALIHVPSAAQPSLLPTQRRIIRGATSRAAELGFNLGLFSLGEDGTSPRALSRVLGARGVLGVIFLYTAPRPELIDFPWADFSAVAIDYDQREPALHTVCLDHYLTFSNALRRLRDLGYRRVGLFLEQFKDERINHKWSAPFLVHQRQVAATEGGTPVPLLVRERMTERDFLAWHRRYRPDLVVGHVDRAVTWLKHAGIRVPARTAFFSLNWTARTLPCAGLDVRPELQGSVAAETLIAQIHRNERGLPDDPHTIMMKGRWVDGPTLQAQHDPPLPCAAEKAR
jgi:LacI family transcriptional regulator